MERERYIEMMDNLNRLFHEGLLGNTKTFNSDNQRKSVFLFAHCEATMKLADELLKMGIKPAAILDNNQDKYKLNYRGIPVCMPQMAVEKNSSEDSIILIVSRFYAQMTAQMRDLGFSGHIEKLTDYNTYAEYSLSPDTLIRKSERLKCGLDQLRKIKQEHSNYFIVFCPFPALGDIYFCMSYLKPYLDLIRFDKSIGYKPEANNRICDKLYTGCLVCVVGNSQKQVADLFNYSEVLMLDQKRMDETIQAVIYSGDLDCYIAHQDRPYVVDLHRALYKKCIPLETIYKCGIFGLPQNTCPALPINWKEFQFPIKPVDSILNSKDDKNSNKNGHVIKKAIISPYAKSVVSLSAHLWTNLVNDLAEKGYDIYTNVCGNEKALPNTTPISPTIAEMKSAVEQAGLFIGIRSGICDVIKTADCKKIALYPDYYYSDTKWKSIDMYSINGFENIVVKDGDTWNEVRMKINL